MIKKLSYVFVSCYFFAQAHAQIHLQGSVLDEANKGIPFATVLLLNAKDSSLVKGGITTESGVFVFENTSYGRYIVSATMVGYQKITSTVFESTQPDNQRIVLVLKAEVRQLNEVTVSAKRPLFEQQIDRLVVNVASSVIAAGGTALEVIQRSPGITLDKQSNSLKLNGKGSVMVMINGKLMRLPMDAVLQMLEGMSANNIEKIELIAAPPANYDAEGDAGLINIITKSDLNFGTNGTFSGTLGQGWYFRPAATLTLNYRNKTFHLYGDYSFSNNQNRGGWTSYTNFQNTDNNYYNLLTVKRFSESPSHFSKIGFDFNLNKQTILSGLISVFDTKTNMNSPNNSLTYPSKASQQLSNETNLNVFEQNHWQHLMLNMSLRHTFKNKNEWSIDADRLYYYNNDPSGYQSESREIGIKKNEQFRAKKTSSVRLWVLKTDYTVKIDDKTQLEIGLKSALTNLDNYLRVDRLVAENWQEDTQFTQNYIFKEDVLASFMNLSATLNNKTKLIAGVRYEHTLTKVADNKGNKILSRNYGNFFPTIFLSYKHNKTHSFNAGYNKRISRPSYKILVPSVVFVDPNTIFLGNPALFPTISDNVQGSWVLKDQYSFSLRYSNDKNTIVQYQPKFDSLTKQLIYYSDNMAKIKTLSFTASVPIKFTKWWQSQNNATGYWQTLQTNFQETPLNRSLWNFQINTSHTFILPRKISMELTYFYVSPTFWGIFNKLSNSEFTAGIQKVLPKDKGTIRFNITDIFWKNQSRWRGAIPAKNFSQDINFFNEPRVMRFTYNRSFGNQKVKINQNRKTGSEEERQRF